MMVLIQRFASLCQTLPLIALLVLCNISAQAATWFVRGDYTGTSNGSIAAPFATIQTAINAAASGDVIKVRGSNAYVYNENVDFNGKNLVLETETATMPTIVGLGGTSVVKMSGLSPNQPLTNARLEGFIIKNGSVGTSTPAPWGGVASYGGGVILRYALNCVLKQLVIDNCTADYGGGISVYQGQNTKLEKLNIKNCSASAGGGISFESNNGYHVSLFNILITNCNATSHGGGIECNYSTVATMEYLTIANCTAGYAAAIKRGNASRFDAKNCIFANNLPSLTQLNWDGGWTTAASTLTHSIVTGSNNPNFAANNIDLTLTNCSDVNPQFVGAADFHLQPSSPAINGGTLTAVTLEDLEGNARPINGVPDMGCYEMGIRHEYQLDTTIVRCGQATCMPVKLAAPVVNGTGWTLEIDFDTTQIRPSTHTLGRIVTGGAMSTFVNNGKLILSIYLTAAANVQGNVGDTLICLGWESVKTNIPPNSFAAIAGTIETNTLLGTTTAPVQSRMKLESNNSLYLWVSYQGTRPMTHNNIVNQTYISIGNTPNGMNVQGIANNTGLYLLNTTTDTLVQVKRQSLPSIGIPVIQGIDAALVFQVIARNPSYRPTVAAILSMDVNGDGRITAGDITDIQRRAVGIYATGFPQFGTNDTISSRHFPQTWLTTHKTYRLSTTYPKWDSVGCAREFVPKIDTLFKIDPFYRNRCDTAFLDVAMLMLGDADGNYNGDTLSHQRLGRQSVTTMNYEICNNIKNNILYIKVYADKSLTGGDWILQNSPLTLLGAEVADSKTTLMTANLVGNNLYVTASAISADIPARTPLFYLKVPALEKERIKKLSDLGNLTGYWNASVADNVIQFCTPVSGTDEPSPIRLYPNPTSNGFVTIEHLDKMPEKIQVYNALGQLVIPSVEPQQQQTPLDLTLFADGVYFVKEDHQMFKVVKK